MSIISEEDRIQLKNLTATLHDLLHYMGSGKTFHLLRDNEEEILLGMIQDKVDTIKEILEHIEIHQTI